MKKSFTFFVVFLFVHSLCYATHNRSGEITFHRLSHNPQDLSYQIDIITYTNIIPPPGSSSIADRPSLTIYWGDGDSSVIDRTLKTNISSNTAKNLYRGTHTYPGPFTYIISFRDPNRNAGILNFPNSVNIPFYVETELIIDPFLGFNDSPILLQPPIDKGAVDRKFVHNPNAYDPDGDSLSYRLVPCRSDRNQPIPDFITPEKVTNPPYKIFKIDSVTGDLVWDSPVLQGEYNVAIEISEWRKFKNHYQKIGYVIRDLQITIEATNNKPPIVSTFADTCIVAGSILADTITATDPDNQLVTLSATGGPLTIQNNPATFVIIQDSINPVKGLFNWATTCEHVRKQPYQVVFKGNDNDSKTPLVDLKSVRIHVVAPAPQNLQANAQGNAIQLKWNREKCGQSTGYKIYRKNDSTLYQHGVCETGLPSSTGFVLIDEVNSINDTSYTDDNKGAGLLNGIKYCYRVVAKFPDGVESYTSEQDCAELKKDLPVITLADVIKTDSTNGKINVRLSKPTVKDLDTIANPGDYKFELFRDAGASPIETVTSTYFKDLNDTTFTDSLINTKVQHNYKVKFYTATTAFKGTSFQASSILLTITPTDNRLILSWQEQTPWMNKYYRIYRKEGGVFTLLDSTTTQTYADSGLANGVQRCYIVESVGNFTADGFPKEIINKSQEECGAPVDNVSPCAPVLTVQDHCETFENILSWTNPNKTCSDDVLKYKVYHKTSTKSDWGPALTTLDESSNAFAPDKFSFTHDNLNASIAGCYSVTSIDSAGNESAKSNVVCVDNCPAYKLPNIFTPNNDTYNDVFNPFVGFRFIQSIEIKIFNRWGQLMFTSNGPTEFAWDGRNQSNGMECSDGTYFYICEINEIHLDQITKRTIKGFVELVRSANTKNQSAN